MTDRVFQVWGNVTGNALIVSDAHDVDEKRPNAVMFPISVLYDEKTQEKRAQDYANYLNKLNEAAKVAYEQIHLVDVLKR